MRIEIGIRVSDSVGLNAECDCAGRVSRPVQSAYLLHGRVWRPVLRAPYFVLVALMALLIGCAEEPVDMFATEHARRAAAEDSTTVKLTPEKLRKDLNTNELATFLMSGGEVVEANLLRSGARTVDALKGLPLRGLDLGFTHVSDLSPLSGMKLTMLVLESTPVSDISVLKGMPLEILKLQNTKVEDFSVIAGMPLEQFNVLNLPFSDLSLLKDMPLNTLWLTGSNVTDLSGLPVGTLVSLDIENTEISTLDSLARQTTLRRLNIANTPVSDVSPLKDLRLERLILSPDRIRTGMESLRTMTSLVLIQTSIEEELSAEEFWKRYDLGIWKPADETPPVQP